MDQDSKEVLEKILAKSIDSLTESDKGFLRARASYLNASQLETYADILEDAGVTPLSEMSLKQLKAHAKELGVDITGLTKLADIVSAIEAHEEK